MESLLKLVLKVEVIDITLITNTEVKFDLLNISDNYVTFIENNSEILDHQDINETMIQPSNPLPLVENPRTRQFMTFKMKKSKLNDTNFETLGCSRDNISPLDHRLKSGKNYHTCKGDYMQSDEEAKSG